MRPTTTSGNSFRSRPIRSGDQAIADQTPQIVGEVGVGIVDRLVLADQAAQLLPDLSGAGLERRVRQLLLRLDRAGRRRQRQGQQQRRDVVAAAGGRAWQRARELPVQPGQHRERRREQDQGEPAHPPGLSLPIASWRAPS